jgi:hypothetical protein
MMRLDVEGHANIFKLSEGAPEQVDGELCVIEERFLIGVLGRRLCDNPPRKIPYYRLRPIHLGR